MAAVQNICMKKVDGYIRFNIQMGQSKFIHMTMKII